MMEICSLKAEDFNGISLKDFDCFWTEVSLRQSCLQPYTQIMEMFDKNRSIRAFLIYQSFE